VRQRLRASVVCVHDEKVLVFKGVDPTSGRNYWFLPGGKVEEDEKPWQCAEREALEETGYRLKVAPQSEVVKDYLHWWDGHQFACTTYFYKGVLTEAWCPPKPVQDASYNQGATWLPVAEALAAFSYTPEIRDAVEKLIALK